MGVKHAADNNMLLLLLSDLLVLALNGGTKANFPYNFLKFYKNYVLMVK